MIRTAFYRGRVVTWKPCPKEKFDTLVLDAKRIIGTEPAHYKPTTRTNIRVVPTYLTPPIEVDPVWDYANHILQVKWPAAWVWTGYPLLVSERDLEYD